MALVSLVLEVVYRYIIIFSFIGIGAMLVRIIPRYSKQINKILVNSLIYIFVPLLIPDAISSNFHTIAIYALRLVLIATILVICCLSTGILISREILKSSNKVLGSIALTSAFQNAVFLPFPLILMITESSIGIGYASIFAAVQFILYSVLGVPICVLYGERDGSLSQIISEILLFPPSIATLLSIFLGYSNFSFRELLTTYNPRIYIYLIKMCSEITLFFSLIVVGVSVGSRRITVTNETLVVSFIRFLLSPLLAGLLILFMRLGGLVVIVILIESIMPPAVLNVVLAEKFGLDSSLTSEIIITTTLISVLLVIPVIVIL